MLDQNLKGKRLQIMITCLLGSLAKQVSCHWRKAFIAVILIWNIRIFSLTVAALSSMSGSPFKVRLDTCMVFFKLRPKSQPHMFSGQMTSTEKRRALIILISDVISVKILKNSLSCCLERFSGKGMACRIPDSKQISPS